MASSSSPTTTSSKTTQTSTSSPKLVDPSTSESEFPNGKVAVGAAVTFIEELKATLTPVKYQQIIELLTGYYTHSLTEKDVYVLVRNVLRDVEGAEGLLRGFERFLPLDVVGGGEEVKGGEEKKVKPEV